MNVSYSEGTKRTPVDERLLEEVNAQLRELLGRYQDEAKAEWSRAEDGAGRPLFILRLSRWTLEASLAFTEDDLRDAHRTWWRMITAYDGMLGRRSRELLDEAQAAG